jgi:hypothetical protein
MGFICDTLPHKIRDKCQHFMGVTWMTVNKMDGGQTEV